MEKTITIEPAFDKRHPDPHKDYGIHGCNMRFVLNGDKRAVQFLLFTNWQLPHVTEEFINKSISGRMDIEACFLPMPADLGYHSPKPMYDEQKLMDDKCEILGGPCYYDGSGLIAEPVYEPSLAAAAGLGVWKELEKYYKETFGE